MAKVTTLSAIYQPMMGAPSITTPYCAICGRHYPLEQHHIVRRSAGKMYDEFGHELKKPTVTLCGFGNNLKGADGYYCHGLAHANRLHFRWVTSNNRMELLHGYEMWRGGHWEYLITEEPTDYVKALDMEGWRRLCGCA